MSKPEPFLYEGKMVEPVLIFHDEGPTACGADITAHCMGFVVDLSMPEQNAMGRILLTVRRQFVAQKPMICPACLKPMFHREAGVVQVADKVPS